VKRNIFTNLCRSFRSDALIAANMSSSSIKRPAVATDQPELLIGIHLINPVPVKQLVELIHGIPTSRHATVCWSLLHRPRHAR
jgi:3-hydroxybutyryl-CoA dehydrogenase